MSEERQLKEIKLNKLMFWLGAILALLGLLLLIVNWIVPQYIVIGILIIGFILIIVATITFTRAYGLRKR